MENVAMDDNEFWTLPPDRPVHGGGGRCDITVLQPPFDRTACGLPPNDPDRAREFAASFPTVDGVLADLGTRPAQQPLTPAARADLDVILAGAWGPVLGVSDAALCDNDDGMPLLAETTRLRERFPDARIVGRAEVHVGATHTEDVVWLPDGTMFHAYGWTLDEPWTLTGDPHEIVRALGVTVEQLEEAFIDLTEEPGEIGWAEFVSLALGDADPWRTAEPQASVLRVRHTEEYTASMESLYFPR